MGSDFHAICVEGRTFDRNPCGEFSRRIQPKKIEKKHS